MNCLFLTQPWQVPKSRLYNPEEWEIALAELQGPDMDDSCLVSQGSGVMDSGIKVEDTADAEPQEPGKPVKEQRKALTLKERLEICQATERQRLSFCKASDHFVLASPNMRWLCDPYNTVKH